MDRTDDVVERAPENGIPGQPGPAESGEGEFDLARIRELILAAYPDVVPDLIAGASLDEMMASVEPARAAYARIAENIRNQPGGAPGIPAGQPGRQPSLTNVEGLSASAKIAEGLRRRRG